MLFTREREPRVRAERAAAERAERDLERSTSKQQQQQQAGGRYRQATSKFNAATAYMIERLLIA